MSSYAQIFKCLDKSGSVTYQQFECSPEEDAQAVEIQVDKVPESGKQQGHEARRQSPQPTSQVHAKPEEKPEAKPIDIATAKERVKEILLFPESAKFGPTRIINGPNGKVVCGTVDARTLGGGVNKNKMFAVSNNGLLISPAHSREKFVEIGCIK
jgi:hypothetical protein